MRVLPILKAISHEKDTGNQTRLKMTNDESETSGKAGGLIGKPLKGVGASR
jgi:hypothetical protein